MEKAQEMLNDELAHLEEVNRTQVIDHIIWSIDNIWLYQIRIRFLDFLFFLYLALSCMNELYLMF